MRVDDLKSFIDLVPPILAAGVRVVSYNGLDDVSSSLSILFIYFNWCYFSLFAITLEKKQRTITWFGHIRFVIRLANEFKVKN